MVITSFVIDRENTRSFTTEENALACKLTGVSATYFFVDRENTRSFTSKMEALAIKLIGISVTKVTDMFIDLSQLHQ